MITKQKFDFDYFYGIYRRWNKNILKTDKKYPDDISKYSSIARSMEGTILNICLELYLEEVLPNALERYPKFYEKEFFKAIENEELPMLFILALTLHNNTIYHQYITAESKYQLMHKCLDILHKNGTDMLGNNMMAMVYENILLWGYCDSSDCDIKGIELTYNLCKKLFALEETVSWKECNISRMYYDTFDGLRGEGAGKREFDLLVDFYHKTTLTFIKKEYLMPHLYYFVNAGLCDENFNWLEKE